MSHVFISYSRKDEETIEKLVESLKTSEVAYWWDRQLKPGDNFSMEIEKRIGEARSVLVTWSPAARASVYVRGEALAALDQRKLKQAMLDDAPPPVPFNAEHAVKLKGWTGDAADPRWSSLVEQLKAGEGASPSPQRTRAAERKRDRDIVRAGASGAQLAMLWLVPMLMVVLLGAGLWLGVNKDPAPFGVERENLFLGIGGSVILLLAVFVALLASTMLKQLTEVDPRGARTST